MTNTQNTTPVQIRIPTEQLLKLRELSEKTGITMSRILTDGLVYQMAEVEKRYLK
jgi:hypothetical protein